MATTTTRGITGDVLCCDGRATEPLRTRGRPWSRVAAPGPTGLWLGAGDRSWVGYPLATVVRDDWTAVVVGEVTVGGAEDLAVDTLAALRGAAGPELPLDRPGHWAVVVVAPDGTVHVLTDRFGTIQVFVGVGDRVAVGTEMAAVEAAAGLGSGAEGLDWTALATWASLGFHAGDRTHRDGLRVARPSSHLTVAPDGSLSSRRAWRWNPDPRAGVSTEVLVGEIDDLLAEVLDAHAADGPLAVPVSGGLDSRTTVAVLTRPGGPAADLWAYSYGYGRLSPELAVARAVGAARGLPVTTWTVPPYLLDDLDRAAAALEGAQDLTQTRQLGVIDEVARHAPRVVAAHWGDVWFDTVGVGSRPLAPDVLLDKVLAKFAKPAGWLASNLVGPHLAAPVEEVVREVLAEELRPYLALEHPEWVLKAFKTDQWSARWTVPSLRAFHAGAQPRLPFYDSRVADWFLGVPVEVHAERALQRALLVHRHADLARVPWEVTGRPLAGRAPLAARADLLLRRAGRGVRLLARRPQPLRSWEVQLRGGGRTEQAATAVAGSPVAELVAGAPLAALWRDLSGPTPTPAVGYPASMLVSLAAELRRRA